MTVALGQPRTVPIGSVDVLPRLGATAWPHRAALRAGERTVTFAALDREVSRLAFGLRQSLGAEGLPVVVWAGLGLTFPTAFFAVVRSGNVVAPVNPRMPAETFAGVLADTGAKVVVLGRVMYERVRHVLAEAGLELVVLQDAPAESGQLTCAELATRGSLLVDPGDRNELAPAVLSVGGRPGRTHQELKTQALALAAADGLDASSVVLNATPSYHPVHLAAGLVGGATQVLWANPDPAAALREALRTRATHMCRDGARTVPVPEAVAS
jgi:acyl-CoA synthetase (AMP-forming)/AMP-acid ligase II